MLLWMGRGINMSETALTVQSLGDAVKDKVRKAMMDAIPDDALQGLIKAEFDKFFIDQQDRHYSSNPPTPSAFKTMVKREIETAMNEKVKEIIKGQVNKVTTEWESDGGYKVIGELVEKMAPAALTGTMITGSKVIWVQKSLPKYAKENGVEKNKSYTVSDFAIFDINGGLDAFVKLKEAKDFQWFYLRSFNYNKGE